MTRTKLAAAAVCATVLAAASGALLRAQVRGGVFRSTVELVRISVVVKDARGRFVQGLVSSDFEVLEDDARRPIVDFRDDLSGLAVGLLFDVSGSMRGQMVNARDAATHVLNALDPARDEAAVYTFDTELDELTPFTVGLSELPAAMATLVPYGSTSLHDALAQAARRVGAREGRRRAVVGLTDGNDNASRMTPAEVSALASGIDVPVYIIGTVASIDNPSDPLAAISSRPSPMAGLAALAAGTGGALYVASTSEQRRIVARQIVDELRHQYLIAFESSAKPGWQPLVVRTFRKDLTVRARKGYQSGQSRPTSE